MKALDAIERVVRAVRSAKEASLANDERFGSTLENWKKQSQATTELSENSTQSKEKEKDDCDARSAMLEYSLLVPRIAPQREHMDEIHLTSTDSNFFDAEGTEEIQSAVQERSRDLSTSKESKAKSNDSASRTSESRKPLNESPTETPAHSRTAGKSNPPISIDSTPERGTEKDKIDVIPTSISGGHSANAYTASSVSESTQAMTGNPEPPLPEEAQRPAHSTTPASLSSETTRIEVNHPEYGNIQLELRAKPTGIDVRATTSRLDAAMSLRASETTLRDTLKNNGTPLRALRIDLSRDKGSKEKRSRSRGET